MNNNLKKSKYFLLAILVALVVFAFMYSQGVIAADNLSDAWQKAHTSAGEAGYDTNKYSVEDVISTIIQITLSFLGVIFLVLMIYGGYLWMTAKGNEEQVTKAKNLIIAAVIGLVIVLAAYAISWFVISKLGGATLKAAP